MHFLFPYNTLLCKCNVVCKHLIPNSQKQMLGRCNVTIWKWRCPPKKVTKKQAVPYYAVGGLSGCHDQSFSDGPPHSLWWHHKNHFIIMYYKGRQMWMVPWALTHEWQLLNQLVYSQSANYSPLTSSTIPVKGLVLCQKTTQIAVIFFPPKWMCHSLTKTYKPCNRLNNIYLIRSDNDQFCSPYHLLDKPVNKKHV